MVLFDSGELTFFILSEFQTTDEDLPTKSNNSQKFELSEFIYEWALFFNFWLIEVYSISFECLGLLQTKLFGSRSDSTSSMKIYKS